ncbi:MAG: coproporphyrinogen dehydrogenase HemZ, partial [Epulopiscium sp.]|nr:coproporphyrinogen dehydrogenase HemZ [Candidatus Epulonipiscium sp.]
MITVILIGHKFQYEIEHLLKAFYPQEEFQFIFTHRVKPSLSLENSKVYIYSVWEGKRFYGEIHVNRKVYQKEYQEDLMDMEEIPRRKKAKRLLKRVLYEAMVLYQKRPLPWGILTGIRPTKIVHELLEHEYSDEKISTILSKQYHIQPDKISLLKQVAKKEKKILDQNKPREISIYIGIPFCPTRCIYCSFTSYPIEKWKDYVDTYIRSLMKEIEAFQYIYKNYPIKSLYIGG